MIGHIYFIISMQALHQQNDQLRRTIQAILQQIQRQKDLNSQHQSQIQTLLKFNQRLLGIIETQLNNKKDSCSLQPISQRSQRESDLIGTTIQSLIRSKKLTARSERGPSTRNSLVDRVNSGTNRLAFLQKDGQKSELDKSYDHQDLSERKLQQKTASAGLKGEPYVAGQGTGLGANRSIQAERAVAESTAVKQEMNKEIAELKRFRNDSARFYDNKIKEIKGLSSKLNSYKPIQQFKQISDKLTLSSGTSELIRKLILKNQKNK